MPYYFGNMMGWGWGGFIMILFWLGIVLLVMWGIREISGRHQNQSSRPLEILKERYAKGEISKEEFEAKKKDIAG